jgi:hypothetical protein
VLAVFAVFCSELSAMDIRFAAESLAHCRHEVGSNSKENSEITAKQQQPLPSAAPLWKQ